MLVQSSYALLKIIFKADHLHMNEFRRMYEKKSGGKDDFTVLGLSILALKVEGSKAQFLCFLFYVCTSISKVHSPKISGSLNFVKD